MGSLRRIAHAASARSLFAPLCRPSSSSSLSSCAGAGGGDEGDASSWAKAKESSAVYGGGSSPRSHTKQRVTLRSIVSKYKRGVPISMVTAYDYPSAKVGDPPRAPHRISLRVARVAIC